MHIEGEQILLRIYLRTTDQHHLVPVYRRLVGLAASKKMAGATVLEGIYGFGARGVLREPHLAIMHNVPVIVEFVDRPEIIAAFLDETLGHMLIAGTLTLERAHVMMWRKRDPESPSAKLALAGQIAPLSTIPGLERSGIVHTNSDGLLLRIFIGDSDHTAEAEPLYKAIVHKARELGLKGATVLRGSMGFGANSVLHTSKILELSTDLPLVIEIVDERDKIQQLLPYLEANVQEGMMTLEDVRILMYRHNPADAGAKQ